MSTVFNREKEPWVRPWNTEKFDNLYNRDERFFAIVIKGLISWLNRNIVLYNKSVNHFIFNTGSSYLYMESNGYEYNLSETTGEDTMYMQLPRCIMEIQGINFPNEELSSPFARGNYERRNGNMLCGYNAEIRRLPIELDIDLKYYLSNFNETIIILQELIDKLIFQQYYNISYLGQVIQCSIEFPGNVNPEINKIDMSSPEPNQRNVNISVKICTNYPLINERTEIPTDKVIVAYGMNIDLFLHNNESDSIEKGTIMNNGVDEYDEFINTLENNDKNEYTEVDTLEDLINKYDTNNDGVIDENDIEHIMTLIKYESADSNDGYYIKYDVLTKMIHIINMQENISVEYDKLTNNIYVNHHDTGITYAIDLKKYKVQNNE
jgi:Ca2+-binding EF-hand superfamily protein